MASPTYTARVIVLRKTKLGESDLALALLAEDGSQLRAVAKGARKPTSSFASRLELYSVADVLCAQGRSLDIVKEARLVASNDALRRDMEHAAGAAPVAELLDRMTQAGLEAPRLFALTEATLSCMCQVPAPRVPALTAAHLLKALAFAGLRPSLDVCAVCGAPVALDGGDGVRYLSCREGGVVCSACRAHAEVVPVSAATLGWARFLLASTLADVASSDMGLAEAFAVLQLCHQWVREHVGSNLKSLNFLFTSGLFAEA